MPPAWLRIAGGNPHLLIVVGAAGFIVNGWWHGALPSAALNVIRLLIGAFALWRIWLRRKPISAPPQ